MNAGCCVVSPHLFPRTFRLGSSGQLLVRTAADCAPCRLICLLVCTDLHARLQCKLCFFRRTYILYFQTVACCCVFFNPRRLKRHRVGTNGITRAMRWRSNASFFYCLRHYFITTALKVQRPAEGFLTPQGDNGEYKNSR